ncbi:hypothetical protein ACFL96_18145 [Thermoproteota archaeon]
MMSSKRLFWATLILTILLIATALSASALTEDFLAYSNKETINACACDLAEDRLYVQNTGDITSTFILQTGGEAATWSTAAPNTFYLEQGERKEIMNYINVPCHARGEYELTTKFNTLFDYEKSLTQTVNVENCPNVQLAQKSFTQETCPCSPTTYEFEIINTGKHTESYKISVAPYEDYATVSDPILVLEPGQSYTVYAFLNLPCDVYGEQEFTINALAEGTGMLGELEFNLIIDACYDYRLESEDEYNICMNVQNVVPVEVTNLVDIANRYHLTIDGPLWANFVNDTVFAWGKQISVANLLLEPMSDDLLTEEGEQIENFEITVNAVTERGKIEESKTINVNVENCYDLNIVLQETEVYGIIGETKDYGVLLENSGTKEASYLLEVFGPEWAYLSSEPEITLQPAQTREILVTTMVPEDAETLQQVSVVGTIPDYGVVRSNFFTLEPVTLEEAYMLDIIVEDRTISYEGDVIVVPVTNLGFRESLYTATVTGPAWLLAENTKFVLAPGDNTSIILHAAPTEDVMQDKYAIDIEITPADTGLYYTTSFLLGVGEKTFLQWIADNWLLATLLAVPIILLILLLILWLIVRRRREAEFKDSLKEGRLVDLEKVRADEETLEEKKRRWWVIPLVILVILALVAGGAFLAMQLIPGAPADVNETLVEEGDVPEVVDEEPTGLITDDQGLITIDRSAIPGDGNILEISEPVQLMLEMEVKNPTDKNVIFRLAADNDEESWLSIPEDELYITPHGTADAQLIITPDIDKLRKNDYTISVGVSLTGEQIDYDQSLDLVIHKKKSFFDTWWFWAIIGVLVAVAAILIIASIKRSAGERKEKDLEEDTYYEEGLPEEDFEKRPSIWRKLLIILVILALVACVLFAGWYFTQDQRSVIGSEELEDPGLEEIEEDTQEIDEMLEQVEDLEAEEQTALVEIDLSEYPGQGNELVVEDNSTIYLSMLVTNPTSERALFTAETSDESWISVEDPSIELAPQGSYETVVMITPDLSVLKKQDYAISINSTLANEDADIDYSQSLDFVITKDNKWYESSWLYVLMGVVIALLAIWLITRNKEKKDDEYEYFFGEDEKVEEVKEEKKPKKKAKKKRTKLQLDKK